MITKDISEQLTNFIREAPSLQQNAQAAYASSPLFMYSKQTD